MAIHTFNNLQQPIAFVGGGNMASAIIGGLIRQGMAPANIEVVEPFAEARAKLHGQYGVVPQEHPGSALARAGLVVWAVKPRQSARGAGDRDDRRIPVGR
jgi:pyrroline-5-carboxylate reductase